MHAVGSYGGRLPDLRFPSLGGLSTGEDRGVVLRCLGRVEKEHLQAGLGLRIDDMVLIGVEARMLDVYEGVSRMTS